MSKFKEGDIVKVIDNSRQPSERHEAHIGRLGRVYAVATNYCLIEMLVDAENDDFGHGGTYDINLALVDGADASDQ